MKLLCCNIMRHLRFMHALLDSIKTTLQPIDGLGLSRHTLIYLKPYICICPILRDIFKSHTHDLLFDTSTMQYLIAPRRVTMRIKRYYYCTMGLLHLLLTAFVASEEVQPLIGVHV